MISRKIFATIFVVLLVITSFTPLFSDTYMVEGEGLPKQIDRITPVSGDGYIWINDVDGLKAIGTNGSNPMNGNYILGSDITFAPEDDIGTTVTMTLTISGNTLEIDIPSAESGIAFLNSKSVFLTDGHASFDYDPAQEYVLAVGGNDGMEDFAYSMNISKDYVPSNPVEFASNGNFIPIGTSSSPFGGTFNGNGYGIKGMNIAVYSNNEVISAGMFAYISGEKINNLIMEEGKCTVVSSMRNSVSGDIIYAGTVAGCVSGVDDFTIENCRSSNDLVVASYFYRSYTDANNANVGGMIGSVSVSDLILEDCINTGDITGLYDIEYTDASGYYIYSGGIAGRSSAKTTISDCRNQGDVRTSFQAIPDTGWVYSRPHTGGIVGFADEDIQFIRCSNSGEISTAGVSAPTAYANSRKVFSYQYVGGILAYSSISSVITFDKCYNNSKVKGSLNVMNDLVWMDHMLHAGGICNVNGTGAETPLEMRNCHNTGDITAEVRTVQDPNEPILHGNVSSGGLVGRSQCDFMITDCYNEGDITSVTKMHYNDPTSYPTTAGGIMGYAFWTGKTVTMDGCHNSGNITLVANGIIDSTVNNHKFDQYIGGLVAYVYTLNVSNSSNAGDITFNSVSDVTVYHSNANVSILAYVGGIAGRSNSAVSILKCYNEGDISVSNDVTAMISTTQGVLKNYTNVGGIFGKNDMSIAKIKDCYNRGNIQASFDSDSTSGGNMGEALSVGGIAGYSGPDVSAEFSPFISVINCYNIGRIAADSNTAISAGSIIGKSVYTEYAKGSVTFSYFLENWVTSNGSVNNSIIGSGSVDVDNGYTGETLRSGPRTSTEMKDKNTFYDQNENKGWDFTPVSGIWKINPLENGGHPFLNRDRASTYIVQLFTDSDAAYDIEEKGPLFGTEISITTYFEFSVSLNQGYQGQVIVKENDVVIDPFFGNTYRVIGNAGEVIAIDILGATPIPTVMTYVVLTPDTDVPYAYTITATGTYDFNDEVPVGTDFEFSIKVNTGYSGPITVKKDGSPMTDDAFGNFIITGASADDVITITVRGASPMSLTFVVELWSLDLSNAYLITTTGNYEFGDPVPVGTEFTFRVEIADGYTGTLMVKAGNAAVQKMSDEFSVSGVAGEIILISISGATPNSAGDDGNDRSCWWILLLVIIVASVSIYLLYSDKERKT